MREMRQQGYSYQEIANIVGVSRQRIFQLLDNYKNTGKKGREEKYRNFGKCQECKDELCKKCIKRCKKCSKIYCPKHIKNHKCKK